MWSQVCTLVCSTRGMSGGFKIYKQVFIYFLYMNYQGLYPLAIINHLVHMKCFFNLHFTSAVDEKETL